MNVHNERYTWQQQQQQQQQRYHPGYHHQHHHPQQQHVSGGYAPQHESMHRGGGGGRGRGGGGGFVGGPGPRLQQQRGGGGGRVRYDYSIPGRYPVGEAMTSYTRRDHERSTEAAVAESSQQSRDSSGEPQQLTTHGARPKQFSYQRNRYRENRNQRSAATPSAARNDVIVDGNDNDDVNCNAADVDSQQLYMPVHGAQVSHFIGTWYMYFIRKTFY